MTTTQEASAPDTTELELRANQAREQLLASLAQLDERAKHIAHTAADTGTAGALCMAAAATLWLSTSLLRRPKAHALPPQRPRRTSVASILFRGVLATAGVVAAGMLLRAAERRVHVSSVKSLPSGM
jgi:hypothetical protein